MTNEDRSPVERLEGRTAPRGAARMIDAVHTELALRRSRRRSTAAALVLALVVGLGVLAIAAGGSGDPAPADLRTLDQPDTSPVATSPTVLIMVPDVEGLGVVEAANRLTEGGFTIARDLYVEPSASIAERDVVGTDPPAGSTVAVESTVTLRVSSGPEPTVVVPSVAGLFYDTGEITLRNAGFEPVPEFRTVPFGDPQVGLIIDQIPAPGTQVGPGAEIVIVVGEAGPE